MLIVYAGVFFNLIKLYLKSHYRNEIIIKVTDIYHYKTIIYDIILIDQIHIYPCLNVLFYQ